MNLSMRLETHGQLSPEREALVYNNQRLSYRDLNTMVNKLATGLSQIGVKPGDMILLALDNCPEFIISYYAIIRMGSIVIPANPQFSAKEFSLIITDVRPKAMITSQELAPLFKKLAAQTETGLNIIAVGKDNEDDSIYSFEQMLDSEKNDFVAKKTADKDDVIVIMYTRGNSGSLKGAMLTQQNLHSTASAHAKLCKMTPRDRSLLFSPAYFTTGQNCVMNATILAGATLVLEESWKGIDNFLATIQREKITYAFCPPTIYSLLIKYPEKYDLSSWRFALTGASPTPKEIFSSFKKKFGFELIECYGLTETSAVVTEIPVDGVKKSGSIGIPLPGVQVKIVDYDGREVPKNWIGEVVVKGPNVMKGYYKQPEETSLVIKDGWFHTGDLAYMDHDGYLFIMDRKKDLIIKGAINIFPSEIENVLYSHPDIFEVVLTGVPDSVMGEEIMAFISVREGSKITKEEIQEFCAQRLATYKIPKYIKFLDNLPKTTMGKLLKGELRKLIAEAIMS